MINANLSGIYQYNEDWNYFGYWGWSLNNDSHYTMGDVSFSQNTIDGENGTYLNNYWRDWGVWMNGTSSYRMGSVLFNDLVCQCRSGDFYGVFSCFFGVIRFIDCLPNTNSSVGNTNSYCVTFRKILS